ncbi:MAG: YggT family protein [Chloroflexota bacterium]
MTGGLLTVVRLLVIAAWVVLLGRVLISWVDPGFRTPLGRVLRDITEPVLAPIRRVLPQTGMLDLAPLVVFLVLGVLLRVVA